MAITTTVTITGNHSTLLRNRVLRALLIPLLLLISLTSFAQQGDSPLQRFCSGESALQSQALAQYTASKIRLPVDAIESALFVLEAIARRRLVCADNIPLLELNGQWVSADNPAVPAQVSAEQAAPPKTNLKLRAHVASSIAMLSLVAKQTAEQRLAELAKLERRRESATAELLDIVAQREADSLIKEAVLQFRSTLLLGDPDANNRIEAIVAISQTATRRNLAMINEALSEESVLSVIAARDNAIASIERRLLIGDLLSTVYSGLSYASVLFLAALGLSIIFGLMGVINLAQGELIMIGAYITWLVQELIQTTVPNLLDYYLLVAIPAAFIGAAAIGLLMEILVVSRLYNRPLMTLLATWALSLLLINTVRVVFGTQNLEFHQPAYVAGGIPLVGDFIMTNNRLFAIAVAVAAGLTVFYILRRTMLGLNIAAVTKHRDTSEAMGINTRQVNRVAFALGSGMAGLAGTALSPLYNVNPNMGTNFIVDSFMVVVLGGVGSLLGTVVAALGIGQINVIIEPVYGAVAAKVIVLVLIIAFIQRRPEGLFASTLRR